jgi:alpha-L-fucosidase
MMLDWFVNARYGMFVHYGLYSLVGRGEWLMNREEIPPEEYAKLADRFTADAFDAGALCDLAVRAGMRYLVFTTMHHDGFRLYDTELSDFNTVKTAARRDLIAEVVAAARQRGLRIGLYHSLNNWSEQPDGVAALESKPDYDIFIRRTFDRLRELSLRFRPFDILWYDGSWPFNAAGWKAEEMNALMRELQPHIIINGRNNHPGDFATPEGHMGIPNPWRPWEACMTLNKSWGYHAGDNNWRRPEEVLDLLITAAQGRGNLLLNVGPRGDGTVPEQTVRVLETVGDWLKRGGGEAIYDTELFTFDYHESAGFRSDWTLNGPLTAKGCNLYWLLRRYPGRSFALCGLQATVQRVDLLGANPQPVRFTQEGEKVTFTGLPDAPTDPLCSVLRITCDRPPMLYKTGGMRTPRVPHPHYDPGPSDIIHLS